MDNKAIDTSLQMSKGTHQMSNNHIKGRTANALHIKQDNMKSTFCLDKHAHKNCQRIKDSKELNINVMKYATCFKCLKRGR